MNRRFLISSFAAMPFLSVARAATPWTAQFMGGGFDGKSYFAGLYIKLDKDWKTYWRNPGDAGVPPSITAEPNANLASMNVDFPLPLRLVDESGTAFGYHDEVLFPITVTPKDLSQPLNVRFSSFFGVCEKVCTPAKFDAELNFSPKSAPSADTGLIDKWRGLVPKQGTIVKAIAVKDKYLQLSLVNPVSDVFVEGSDNFYFGQPEFDLSGQNAHLKIAGLKNDNELKGLELRLTANINGQGVEQRIVVA